MKDLYSLIFVVILIGVVAFFPRPKKGDNNTDDDDSANEWNDFPR